VSSWIVSVVAPANVLQQLGEPEVSIKTRFLKLRIIPAPIVFGKIVDRSRVIFPLRSPDIIGPQHL